MHNIDREIFHKLTDEDNEESQKSYLSPKEFAKRMGIAYINVLIWLKKGKIKYAQPMGKHGRYFIPESEVDRIFEEKKS